LIGGWIEDYNDNHPHSGLKMRSPREFIVAQTATAQVSAETGEGPGVLGFDGTRIASFGPSAGGHLSASVGIALSADPATRLAASVVWFPPVDFPTMDDDMIATGTPRATGRNDDPNSPESRLIDASVADHPDLARAAGPIARLSDLPPGATLPDMLILHGALDPYIAPAQSHRLHAALAAHGSARRLTFEVLPLGTHGGGQFEDPETMAKVVAFLSAAFATA
jgi:acetyl esterase/lipase